MNSIKLPNTKVMNLLWQVSENPNKQKAMQLEGTASFINNPQAVISCISGEGGWDCSNSACEESTKLRSGALVLCFQECVEIRSKCRSKGGRIGKWGQEGQPIELYQSPPLVLSFSPNLNDNYVPAAPEKGCLVLTIINLVSQVEIDGLWMEGRLGWWELIECHQDEWSTTIFPRTSTASCLH